MQAQKVIWQEGMLLRPQHLQHNDRYYHQQLTQTRLLGSDTWGLLTLELNLQYLKLGKLVVNQASGVLPDGSLFELSPGMEPLVLQVPTDTGRQGVFLAPPLASGSHLEVRQPGQSDVLARYVSCEVEVGDANAGVAGSTAHVPTYVFCWANTRMTSTSSNSRLPRYWTPPTRGE